MQLRLYVAFSLMSLVLPLMSLAPERAVVPEGVRYKKASKQVNDRARASLLKLFYGPQKAQVPGEIFAEKMVFCGPLLWRELRSFPDMKAITKGQWIIRVPIPTKGGVRKETLVEGKFFQGAEEISAFWKALVKTISAKEKFRVRRPTGPELARYWAMIPYDIEEPIFVAESERHTFLIDFLAGQDRIFFVGNYRVRSSKSLGKRSQ